MPTTNLNFSGTITGHNVVLDYTVATEYLIVNQSATIKALTVNIDVYMASGYMSQGVNATNALITSATITNAPITNATITNYTNPPPSHTEAYIIGTNGAGMQPIFYTIKNTSNYLSFQAQFRPLEGTYVAVCSFYEGINT